MLFFKPCKYQHPMPQKKCRGWISYNLVVIAICDTGRERGVSMALHALISLQFENNIGKSEEVRDIYIYIMYMWQMSSVFSHESAQRNDAGHLIDKNVFKTIRSFCYQWFHVSTLQANANRPFILSSMKRTTGGGHLENAFSRWPPPVVRFMLDNMNGLLAFAWRVETWNHW